jgi:hypothetical protein
MNHNGSIPAWGLLAKASERQIRNKLKILREEIDLKQVVYHSAEKWTAAFYMEPSSSGYDEGALLLCASGFAPVYHFDFDRHEYLTWCWDGHAWVRDDDPGVVLGNVGLWIPGWRRDSIELTAPSRNVVARRATVVENATVTEVAVLLNETSIDTSSGPLGTVAYDLKVDAHIQLWELAPKRVFEVLYYPVSADFCLTVMKGDNCLGTFKPGETRTWDGTPFLPDFEGETTAEGVLDKLGIPRSFLDPLPPKATDPGGGNK